MPAPPPHKDRLREERRARYKLGRHAEWIAALALRLRGYRILGRREKTPLGEIDLIAVRGRRLAFIEVKQRATLEAAEAAVTAKQRARIRRAADLWLAQHTRYQSHELGFDIVFLIGRGWPRHLENGL
ncbi:MAG: YraN family protein [Hyphomicrobium zavarzinii]|jgi:putative endonuclease|uniref:YraN family protein n=1 Tax=Hyphomicrobium TaxID=81 RepID=UPI001A39771F|nr:MULTISPECIES: YraN family protein [Hyphomicrobium]MBL8847935.1 YraN family protein [Hyphomicrobium zavarzinii]WBT39084.1 YraN family protein [Hyphomicrobium sp. DMF-1]HML44327.1 YraN family protein [Hyphomicrobium zavarzinii]